MAEHENLPPPGYVQALPVVTHGDGEAPEGVRMMRLARGSLPATIRAMNLIREDNGGPSWPPEEMPRVPVRWQPWLDTIEAAIAALRDDAPAPEDEETAAHIAAHGFCYLDSELYTFCNGEATAMEAIQARSADLLVASRFLNDFFEGWSYYPDGPDFNPLASDSGSGPKGENSRSEVEGEAPQSGRSEAEASPGD